MSEFRHVRPGDEVEVERVPPDRSHPLVQPRTIRMGWIVGSALLAVTVVAEWFVPIHGHAGFDDWFGFAAVFGFVSCVIMVFGAKALGLVLKRPEDHYGE